MGETHKQVESGAGVIVGVGAGTGVDGVSPEPPAWGKALTACQRPTARVKNEVRIVDQALARVMRARGREGNLQQPGAGLHHALQGFI